MAINEQSIIDDLNLLVRVAEDYYIGNKTQTQIASQLGISSSTISRLLNRAREEGIVRIAIVRPQARNSLLERKLCQQFDLKAAVVANVPTDISDYETLLYNISIAAAPYIDSLIKSDMVIGIGRGRSLAALAKMLQPLATSRHITIVQVFGEYASQHSPTRSAEITRQIAEMYDGIGHYLNAPALVEDRSLAEGLLRTPSIMQILPFYGRLDMVLLGAGPIQGSPLEQNGLLSVQQVEQLEAAGAIGDICCHFFSAAGQPVDNAYSGRVIGITWEQLQRCPCIVVFAAGNNKVQMLQALLKARLLQVLVTDEYTAQQLVHES